MSTAQKRVLKFFKHSLRVAKNSTKTKKRSRRQINANRGLYARFKGGIKHVVERGLPNLAGSVVPPPIFRLIVECSSPHLPTVMPLLKAGGKRLLLYYKRLFKGEKKEEEEKGGVKKLL